MLLDLIPWRMDRYPLRERDDAFECVSAGRSGHPLRLVEYTPPVKSREKVRRAARKSATVGGRAFVRHPDPETRSQFDTVLAGLGLTAVDFDDDRSLAEAIASDQPDIVLWGMPGCSSRDLDRIRDAAAGGCLPIVVVADLGDDITLEEVEDAGACDLLFLPLPCHRLAPALSIALLRQEVLEALLREHDLEDDRRAARNLVWRAARVWDRRRGAGPVESLRHVLLRSRARGNNLTRAAMEVVAEGLFP